MLTHMLTYAVIAFAAVFMVTGICRVVEFKAAGLSSSQRRFLIPLHILGCVAFAAALILVAVDPLQHLRLLTTICFMVGLFVLFPLHIFVAIKRRIKISRQNEQELPRS